MGSRTNSRAKWYKVGAGAKGNADTYWMGLNSVGEGGDECEHKDQLVHDREG